MPGMDHILSKGFLATGGSVAYAFGQVVKQAAASTLQPAQCALATATTDAIIGVAQEDLDAVKTNTGKAIIGVAVEGTVKCIAGTNNIAIGQKMTVDSSSRVIASTTATDKCVGIAMSASTAVGDYVDVLLTPGAFCA